MKSRSRLQVNSLALWGDFYHKTWAFNLTIWLLSNSMVSKLRLRQILCTDIPAFPTLDAAVLFRIVAESSWLACMHHASRFSNTLFSECVIVELVLWDPHILQTEVTKQKMRYVNVVSHRLHHLRSRSRLMKIPSNVILLFGWGCLGYLFCSFIRKDL